ncbi:hypothetical protein RJ640_026889 [Escallonia rubra]|uniref:Late embryogenesis abundant protein LEA-2 subgroup domain-containing protein n=1 Tax=Escallonia rubra TaxID=112253 RepID=A0AA88UQJ3_9ASTE|nr:hypothetical protein RJ640_026889 [Escallonia rubra]
MGLKMHAKSDSDVTSMDASSPPRSPRPPIYYVQSPSHDGEKTPYGSSPYASPPHYRCSPIHHSRESSTSRYSASLKNHRNMAAWKRIQLRGEDEDEDEDDGLEAQNEWSKGHARVYFACCALLAFVVLFTVFSLILWAASLPYKPEIVVKDMVFEYFNVQSGMDRSGVPTDMLTVNSTVRISFRNPAKFFGVHVTATPLELHYYQLKLATGHVEKFYQKRKSRRTVVAVVIANQVPLYGAVPSFSGAKSHLPSVSVPLNLTFVMRSRAYILGKLVKPKFYRSINCEVTFKGNRLGKSISLKNSCIYRE